ESALLPAGISLVDNGDGTATLSGVAVYHTIGAHSFSIGATNGVARDALQRFTLNIQAQPCTGVVLTSGAPPPARADLPGSVLFTGAAAGCSAVEYHFSFGDPSNNWTLGQDWGASSTWSWNTSGLTPGTWHI